MEVKFYSDLVARFDEGYWVLDEPLCVLIECDDKRCFRCYAVPDGFTTDLASVPALFRPLLDDDESWIARPAVLHDWLYRTRARPRAMCDRVFREAMRAEGAPWVWRWTVWLFVRLFGADKYEQDPDHQK